MIELSLSQAYPGAVAAFPHPEEMARLNELRRLGILDTSNEKRFDDIVNLAAQVFDMPYVLISLVDANRQWFKANHGLDAHETHRDISFCAHAIHHERLFIVENALLDARFNTNPLVLNAPHIRFYAGAVIYSNNLPLGTLCLIDNKTRTLSNAQKEQLLGFAKLVENELASNSATSNERTQAQIRADYDPLTSFLTRKAFKVNLSYQLSNLKADEHPQYIIYLKVNNLNRLNIEYSRFLGDFVLVELGRRVKLCLQGYNHIIGRLDVNSFGIAIYKSHRNEIDTLIASLDTQFHEVFNLEGITFEVSVTSIVQTCETYLNAKEILSSCEYAAKIDFASKGNFTHLVSKTQQQKINRHNLIRRKLGLAIDKHALSMHYQPKVDSHNHQLVGLEALLRWHDNELGWVHPIDIVDAATDLGLHTHLTEWVITHVCTQLSIWQHQQLNVVPISINLDQYQLRLPEFPNTVKRILDNHGIATQLIEFEITEHTFMQDMPEAIHNMLALQKSGISFSIDDFGTGYSALSSLYRVPINTIKIDKSFIDNIDNNARNAAIVKAIVTFCRSAGLQVLAEGLESKKQYQILNKFNCDQMQGYLFSRPLTTEMTQALLKRAMPFDIAESA